MILSALHMPFDASDLRLKRLNSRHKLFNRHGVEVLFSKLDEWVARLVWKEVV